MKIERLSENQIRCILSKADLNEKQLKISELAYGTQKARELFRDLMRQASVELGFEADDTPLMVEAVPVSPESLILIVTKVEDPEELDTRFSRFSRINEYDIDDDDDEDEYMDDDEYEDDNDSFDGNPPQAIARVEISGPGPVPQSVRDAIEGIFSTITGLAGGIESIASSSPVNISADGKGQKHSAGADRRGDSDESNIAYSLYIFDSLRMLINAAKQVAYFYFSNNSLYKNPADGKYYLVLTNSSNTGAEFTRVCNILTEYGINRKMTYAMPAHFKEHFTTILDEDALQTLSAL